MCDGGEGESVVFKLTQMGDVTVPLSVSVRGEPGRNVFLGDTSDDGDVRRGFGGCDACSGDRR